VQNLTGKELALTIGCQMETCYP